MPVCCVIHFLNEQSASRGDVKLQNFDIINFSYVGLLNRKMPREEHIRDHVHSLGTLSHIHFAKTHPRSPFSLSHILLSLQPSLI